ncbi:site-2 protease family protein [Pirellulaceae bacterium SH467]
MNTPSLSTKEFEKTLDIFRDDSSKGELRPDALPSSEVRRRRPAWVVPTFLLVTTLLSMTWAGIVAWSPTSILLQASEEGSLFVVRQHFLSNWYGGLVFALSLTAILGAHELGHYFATRWYKIPSTLPLFIPFPVSPTGTCGAVIMMDGGQADRKQIFDIGIAGPLAGLVFAIPIAIAGLLTGTPPTTTSNSIQFGQPLIVQVLNAAVHGEGSVRFDWIANSAMNPMLMAAWVGFLVTGLNMVPVSQLDGGHVIFGLLGKRSLLVAWLAYAGAAGFVIYSGYRYGQPDFVIMLLLIPLMGIGHPPSKNDNISLGLGRSLLGWASLSIPFLCIPLRPIMLLG